MKQNQVLSSSDRELFGITIRQHTKNQMLSVTDLQKSYEKARFMHGWKDRKVNHIIDTDDFKERVYYILENMGLVKTDISVFMEMLNREGIVKSLKGLGVWKTTGRGENKMVVANPYVWVLIAMEMNPMIYAKVVTWLTDSLIFQRLEAGKGYAPMNSAIDKIISKPNYPEYARIINIKVFGEHIRGIRNLASAEELRKIAKIEEFVFNAINMKLIDNEEKLLSAINNYA